MNGIGRITRTPFFALLATAFVLAGAGTRVEAAVALGEEFVVTPPDMSTTGLMDVAQSVTGDFVVTWRGTGADGPGIYARLFDADNVPRGEEFMVEPGEIRTNLREPRVAMDAAGNFIVAWRALTLNDRRNPEDIRFLRYSADGSPLGDAESVPLFSGLLDLHLLLVLFLTEGPVEYDLAMNPDGDFVITWLRRADALVAAYGGANGAEIYGVLYARPYATDGTPKRAPVLVTPQAEHRVSPAVVMDDNGGFAVAWREGGGLLAFGDELQVRRYDADGNALARAEAIREGHTSALRWPLSAGMDALGNHVVVWRADGGGQAQRFDADGRPVDGIFQPTAESRENPRVAMAPTGRFAVTWSLGTEVFLLCYAADGTPQGEAFVINEAPGNAQGNAIPTLAYDGFGDLLVAWRLDFPGMREIRARRFSDC